MDKKVDDLVEKSLGYERCFSRVCRLLNIAVGEKNIDDRSRRENEEPLDESHDILIGALNQLKDEYRAKADDFFRQAEQSSDKFEFGYNNLFNAIALRAAQDYEESLCGIGSDENRRMIEMFLPERITKKIRDAYPKFCKVARERGLEILEATQEERRRRRRKEAFETGVTCTLCGGDMFSSSISDNGLHKIKCTNCNLFCFVRIDVDGD